MATILLLSFAGAPRIEAKPKPTKKELKKAKELFERAEAAAAKREYVPSADLYLEAYALFPSTDFIFNAASMYRQANEKELAGKYYEQYLSLDSDGRGAAEAKSVLAQYEAERKEALKAREAAKQKSDASKVTLSPEDSVKESGKVESTPGKSGNSFRLPAIIGMSAGGVLVGVGVFYAVKSKMISDDVSESPGFDPALEKKGRSAERNSYIFGGVGAAVVVGSTVLYVLGSNKKSKEGSALTLVPAIDSESVGAFAYGEF